MCPATAKYFNSIMTYNDFSTSKVSKRLPTSSRLPPSQLLSLSLKWWFKHPVRQGQLLRPFSRMVKLQSLPCLSHLLHEPQLQLQSSSLTTCIPDMLESKARSLLLMKPSPGLLLPSLIRTRWLLECRLLFDCASKTFPISLVCSVQVSLFYLNRLACRWLPVVTILMTCMK